MEKYTFSEKFLARELETEIDGKTVVLKDVSIEGGYIVVGYKIPYFGNLPDFIIKKTITGSGKIVPCPLEVQEKIANLFRIKANLSKLLD